MWPFGWDAEQKAAIINGGERRENNLKPWLAEHHKNKTRQDVAEKSRVYRKAAAHVGIKKPSKFACSRDSGWKKKIDGTIVPRSR